MARHEDPSRDGSTTSTRLEPYLAVVVPGQKYRGNAARALTTVHGSPTPNVV